MPWIPEYFLDNLPKDRLDHLKDLSRRAELELKSAGNQTSISSAENSVASALIRTVPLQSSSGTLLEDAAETLSLAPLLVSEEEGRRIVDEATRRLAESKGGIHLVTNVQELAYELLRTNDPVTEIQKFIATDASVRFYRVIASETFHLRDTLWRFLTASMESGTGLAAAVNKGHLPESSVPDGLSNWPADLIAVPLAARLQPMAMSVRTARGAQILGSYERGLPIRPALISTWPAGAQTFVFRGFGSDVYSTRFTTIPPDWPAAIQNSLLVGSNVLADVLTNPDVWKKPDGSLDIDERNILLASVSAGLAALSEFAEEWDASTNLWSAFRALGILSGIWRDKGSDGKRIALRQMLNPETIRAVAIPRLKPESYRQWAEDVIDKYQSDLTSTMFPNTSLSDSLKLLEHTRHLVHGAGVSAPKKRYDRMRALAGAAKGSAPIWDVAVLWWTALLMDPRGMSVQGPAPFPGVAD